MLLAAGVVLFGGLLSLMRARRDELLQDYLTPEEPELEREFFHLPAPAKEEASPEEEAPPPEQPEQLWPELPPGMAAQ